jgi:hypothetical protein
MAAYVLGGGSTTLFDPAVGEGAFFAAGKKVAAELGRHIQLLGRELDPEVLDRAAEHGLTAADLGRVELRDFVLDPPEERFAAIIANPPYIRHHRVGVQVKASLKAFSTRLLGRGLDGRTGYHVYFLLRALTLLAPEGRLAFIVPADTFEGIFAKPLWKWITKHYRLDAAITFAHEASPFPGVDTNAVVVLVQNAEPVKTLAWCFCQERSDELKAWCVAGMPACWRGDHLEVVARDLSEALATGISRHPRTTEHAGPVLRDYALVMRGIATGGNEFFFLTAAQVHELGLSPEFLQPAIGRTRDVSGAEFTTDDFERLAASGRPCFLLSIDGRSSDTLPGPLQRYLRSGESQGLPQRALIAQRRPWYKMEVRRRPPFLFAYLGRRNARFIRNTAGVVPLTGFLCVYPKSTSPEVLSRLWKVLQHPETIENLKLVGKSYGGGAIKVEPRALEQLPLPRSVVLESGLDLPAEDPQLAIV